jgi:hypothetical protein
MHEEYCDGVKILLKRMESNPEEFKQGNKWSYVLPKESGGFADWGHALTEAEISAISEGIRKIASGTFTDIVMSTLLEDKEEKLYAVGGGGTSINSGWNDPRLAQSAIQPGSWQEVATSAPPKKLTLGEMLKARLANL